MEQDSYDVRGRQSSILRLASFDSEGMIHMLFYRIAIFVALALAISMTAGAVYYGNALNSTSRYLLLALWILFTPQLFETAKAFSIIASHGVVFGRLNESFMKYGAAKEFYYKPLAALPYAAIAVWAIGFAAIAFVWFA